MKRLNKKIGFIGAGNMAEAMINGLIKSALCEPRDIWETKQGEVLVCDAIDPNLTFVMPLVAAIVERRGGMLIHGAIVAREYGLPCVNGVPEATRRLADGDRLTVDGHLGLVIVGDPPPR